jgi:uncharacterized protein
MTKSTAYRPERKAFAFDYKFVDEAVAPGAFEGYGSVCNNEDDGGDLILPGAFAGALQRHQAKSTMPKMLLNHGSTGGGFFGGNDPMADLPVGGRTAGFPQYGWKAGVSGGTFPARQSA